ncbi:MAG TPA: protein-tyrosine-phosphatase [Chthoniobacterales bacterium]
MSVSTTKKLFFACSQNKWRSLTAEKLFEGLPGYQARSVGTQPDACVVVTEGHIGWADIIFCMERSHVDRLRRKFPEALRDKRVVCLQIPDEFGFMDPDLLEEFRAKLPPYVILSDENPKV